jgi:hypothetical protein
MNQKKQNHSEKKEIIWEAPEFDRRPKPLLWYIFFSIISTGLVVWGIYQKSPITVITFIVMAVVIMLFSLKKPEMTTYRLTTTSIIIGKVEYPYKIIKKFWIFYNPPEMKTLNFETSAYLNSTVRIELGSQNPLEVKWFLKNFIIEDIDKEEGFADALARRLKL